MNHNAAAEAEIAQAELFCKVAADQGIDLNALADEDVQILWNEFQKIAEENEEKPEESSEEEKKEDEEEKKEAAAREHAIKVAHAAEEAHADHLGRVMAHAYLDEIQKVAAAREAVGQDKEASALGKMMAARDALKGGASKAKEVGGKALQMAKNHPGKSAGGAAALAAGGGFAAGRASKKQASVSNLDELALRHAVKLAADAGLDAEEAELKVAAVAVLGLPESQKLASDLDSQIHVRALEYLEAAGYPVTWEA